MTRERIPDIYFPFPAVSRIISRDGNSRDVELRASLQLKFYIIVYSKLIFDTIKY